MTSRSYVLGAVALAACSTIRDASVPTVAADNISRWEPKIVTPRPLLTPVQRAADRRLA